MFLLCIDNIYTISCDNQMVHSLTVLVWVQISLNTVVVTDPPNEDARLDN